MSKSKQDSELDELRAERDHWRRIAQERGDENAELHRQLERQSVHAGVFGIDAPRRYDEAMQRFQQERDAARTELAALKNTISSALRYQESEYSRAVKETGGWLTRLNDLATNGTLPELVSKMFQSSAVIFAAMHNGETQLVQRWQGDPRLADTSSPYPHAMTITAIVIAAQRTILHHLAATEAILAYGLAHDPGLICDILIRQCREDGAPNMSVLELLPLDWIQEHLPDPPAKHSTLYEGLTHAHTLRKGGQTYRQYAHRANRAERQLRQYIRWYEAIEQAGRTDVRDMLPQA